MTQKDTADLLIDLMQMAPELAPDIARYMKAILLKREVDNREIEKTRLANQARLEGLMTERDFWRDKLADQQIDQDFDRLEYDR